MAGFTNHLEDLVLDHVFGSVDYTPETTLYVALFTAAPNDTGGGTEVSGGDYAREGLTNNTTNFPNGTDGAKANGVDITFPEATGSWGTISHWGIFDASTSGNLLIWGAVTNPQAVVSGNTVVIPTGDLQITLD